MLRARLLELEAELLAKEEAQRLAANTSLPAECELILEHLERELAPELAGPVSPEWKGFLTYRRQHGELIICRGRAFKESGMFGKWRAGLDVAFGLDTVTEYLRKFDVSPPQDLDHLMVNFGRGKSERVFLWYGENISAYRLIFQCELDESPEQPLSAAIGEGLGWILRKPKDLTLPVYLQQIENSGK
ncbi:MAG: hypothetical protein JST01_28945 [Cyanobacteria bacterium SZAS TMP-1]|nr:hypothetical protein [Cyanobacteria bacterium SZAS TMP-1]